MLFLPGVGVRARGGRAVAGVCGVAVVQRAVRRRRRRRGRRVARAARAAAGTAGLAGLPVSVGDAPLLAFTGLVEKIGNVLLVKSH